MSDTIKVGAAQLAPVFLNAGACVEKACGAIREAGEEGAVLLAFPESYLCGYPYWALFLPPTEINAPMKKLYAEAVEIPSPATDILCKAARQAGCAVVMGLNERDGGTIYNSQLFIAADGTLLGKRRKLIPTGHERMVWGRGDGSDLALFDMPFGKLGALICYEHSNALFRYALQGRGEQIHIANWPGGLPGINPMIDAAVRHYAFEAGCFVLNVTSVVTEASLADLDPRVADNLKPGGGYSSILAPKGQYLAGPEESKEGILYAELDFGLIDAWKAIVDTAGHYARPDVVQLKLHGGRSNVTGPDDGVTSS